MLMSLPFPFIPRSTLCWLLPCFLYATLYKLLRHGPTYYRPRTWMCYCLSLNKKYCTPSQKKSQVRQHVWVRGEIFFLPMAFAENFVCHHTFSAVKQRHCFGMLNVLLTANLEVATTESCLFFLKVVLSGNIIWHVLYSSTRCSKRGNLPWNKIIPEVAYLVVLCAVLGASFV